MSVLRFSFKCLSKLFRRPMRKRFFLEALEARQLLVFSSQLIVMSFPCNGQAKKLSNFARLTDFSAFDIFALGYFSGVLSRLDCKKSWKLLSLRNMGNHNDHADTKYPKKVAR